MPPPSLYAEAVKIPVFVFNMKWLSEGKILEVLSQSKIRNPCNRITKENSMSIADQTKTKMSDAIEHLKNELKSIRTGRANPGMLDQSLWKSMARKCASKNWLR